MTMNNSNYRVFPPLLAVAATFALAACNQQPAPTANVEVIDSTDTSSIQLVVAGTDFAVGQPRIPIFLFSGTERVTDARSVEVTAFDLSSDPPKPTWTGNAHNFSDYEVPYWVFSPEIEKAGFWGMGAVITLSDGTTTTAELTLEVLESPESPAIGSLPPASENRTAATEPDLNKLSSTSLLDPQAEPNPALYQMTIADALTSGRPSVIVFSTPAFCTSQICAPVLNSVETVYQEFGEQANFIHIEIFSDFEDLTVSEVVEEWGLVSEPWTFLLDREGKIAARLGGPVSPDELAAALELLLQ